MGVENEEIMMDEELGEAIVNLINEVNEGNLTPEEEKDKIQSIVKLTEVWNSTRKLNFDIYESEENNKNEEFHKKQMREIEWTKTLTAIGVPMVGLFSLGLREYLYTKMELNGQMLTSNAGKEVLRSISRTLSGLFFKR